MWRRLFFRSPELYAQRHDSSAIDQAQIRVVEAGHQQGAKPSSVAPRDALNPTIQPGRVTFSGDKESVRGRNDLRETGQETLRRNKLDRSREGAVEILNLLASDEQRR